jgi:CheY-like chemotaxis protein
MMKRTLTVVHIDDDPDTRLLLRELVAEGERSASDGIEIRCLDASGVEEAVSRYGGLQPDAVLLDNRLGPESGVDLLPRLRPVWNCPIWILTGLAPEAVRAPGGRSGAAGVASKDELLKGGDQLRSFLLECIGLRDTLRTGL